METTAPLSAELKIRLTEQTKRDLAEAASVMRRSTGELARLLIVDGLAAITPPSKESRRV